MDKNVDRPPTKNHRAAEVPLPKSTSGKPPVKSQVKTGRRRERSARSLFGRPFRRGGASVHVPGASGERRGHPRCAARLGSRARQRLRVGRQFPQGSLNFARPPVRNFRTGRLFARPRTAVRCLATGLAAPRTSDRSVVVTRHRATASPIPAHRERTLTDPSSSSIASQGLGGRTGANLIGGGRPT